MLEIVQRAKEVGRLGAGSTGIDGKDPHAKRPHEAGRGSPDPAKAQNASRHASKQTVGSKLIKFAISQFLVFYEQSFGQGQRHRQHVFSHGSRIGTRIAGDENVWGQVGKRHVVSSRRQELDESDLLQVRIVLGMNFSWEVPREEDMGALQDLFTLCGWDLVEKGERAEGGFASQRLKEQRLVLRRGSEGDHDVLLLHLFSSLL